LRSQDRNPRGGGAGSIPQRLKPKRKRVAFAASLKRSPDTNPNLSANREMIVVREPLSLL
jgi:hypothetical protein